ncbi:MAG: peptidylprolyl isomerase [Solobacterium sp.]|nr:peptidylprolyl isomerase [Solobacterium sp.]
MNSFIKKNWFVSLLVVVFAVISVYYIYDSNKGKLKGKTANGEGVVYSINGEDVTATGLYDSMYKNNGTAALAEAITRAVADQAVETTDLMKDNAASQSTSILNNYLSTYGSDYRTTLDAQLQGLGYAGTDELEAYLINYFKQSELTAQYAEQHYDDLKIRNVSYILIKFEDGNSGEGTPTEDEQARMDAVDEALASGKTFEEAAAEFSEDASTASNGGVLGTLDANTTTLDSAFQQASLSLKEGEISDWVYSENFGYFLIQCNASTPEGLEAFYRAQNGLTEDIEISKAGIYDSLLSSYDTTLVNQAIWDTAEELGISFTDPDTEAAVKQYLGLED